MRNKYSSTLRSGILVFALVALAFPVVRAANNQVLGWNNLGMHCMDSDYSVFSILPPYNTVNAQLIVNGALLTASNGYSVTYEAVADPSGSINKTSAGKGNWHEFAPKLYGAVAVDQGLPFPDPTLSFWMPGTNNTARGMEFDSGLQWFYAYGIPITPYDDAGNKNPYPMMHLVARNSSGTVIATNDIVLPISDEMDCRTCHASGTQASAQPAAGWVWSDNPERDFRLNILRLHDEKNFAEHHDVYVSALAARPGNGVQFNPQGLYRSVVADSQPVLCAVCHASEALGAGSYSNIPPLTASVHTKHATVADPDLLITLDNSAHRAACYRCHPGSTTRCLRGAMGGAIASDGTLEMQCQSCHGNMSHVGRAGRKGWLEEPTCQQCHTGTATSNNGQVRFTSCYTDTNLWVERVATNQTFATKSNTPAPNISLYRFSAGHGGLQCEACHGSTHAEFPATHPNDNVRNQEIQGHAGVMVECTSCHVSVSSTTTNGPHGMHPVGPSWVTDHHDAIHSDAERRQCRACHGLDYRGTELSRAQAVRSFSAFGGKTFWRGYQVGCYTCHNGEDSESANPVGPAVVNSLSTNTTSGASVAMALPATDTNSPAKPFSIRIVSQPAHGAVGVSNTIATYFPDPGFVGIDSFTFAAWNTNKDSNLGTGTVTVAQGQFGLTAKTLVPATYPAMWAAPFTVLPSLSNIVGAVAFDWSFGDATSHSTNQYATHAYADSGNYSWSVVSVLLTNGVSVQATTNTGMIAIGSPVGLAANQVGSSVILSWPQFAGDALLEESPLIGAGADWTVCTNAVVNGGGMVSVAVPNAGMQFYRLRKL